MKRYWYNIFLRRNAYLCNSPLLSNSLWRYVSLTSLSEFLLCGLRCTLAGTSIVDGHYLTSRTLLLFILRAAHIALLASHPYLTSSYRKSTSCSTSALIQRGASNNVLHAFGFTSQSWWQPYRTCQFNRGNYSIRTTDRNSLWKPIIRGSSLANFN